jgi:hypothetical protein
MILPNSVVAAARRQSKSGLVQTPLGPEIHPVLPFVGAPRNGVVLLLGNLVKVAVPKACLHMEQAALRVPDARRIAGEGWDVRPLLLAMPGHCIVQPVCMQAASLRELAPPDTQPRPIGRREG